MPYTLKIAPREDAPRGVADERLERLKRELRQKSPTAAFSLATTSTGLDLELAFGADEGQVGAFLGQLVALAAELELRVHDPQRSQRLTAEGIPGALERYRTLAGILEKVGKPASLSPPRAFPIPTPVLMALMAAIALVLAWIFSRTEPMPPKRDGPRPAPLVAPRPATPPPP